MSDIKTQKRIAAAVLGIGKSRIWIKPDAAAEVSQAMTRDDVRELIKQGLIQEKPAKKLSRRIAKKRLELRRKRKGVGHGKRKGSANARKSRKDRWMAKIRAQRRFLRNLLMSESIDKSVYRAYYKQVKGNRFASIRSMIETMKADGILKPRKPQKVEKNKK